uniref:B3/B4 tRNA-binding domain-containing protein n=1 Tax=Strigamia maritima TaxID=126957 RepID=T1J910_STRMM
MADTWYEVKQAKAENRYELVLSGADVSKRISENGLDMSIFTLINLNFLEISKTTLPTLPDHVADLSNLMQLVLHSNELKTLPSAIGKLTKLKILDVSRNGLTELPIEICSLTLMQRLNLSGNQLSRLPDDFGQLNKLITLNVSQNQLEEFPINCTGEFNFLTELNAKSNKVKNIPSNIHNLSCIKMLDLEENGIKVVPGELADCGKLKELNLKGNALNDKRLKKMVDQCHSKQVLEYIRAHCPKESADSAQKSKSKTKKGGKSKGKDNSEVDQVLDVLEVLHLGDETPVVTMMDAVKDIRPHILCCILRNVDLVTENKFKKFIALQSKLHDNECEKRNSATIATHDLAKIQANLIYDALPPNEIKLVPLLGQKEVNGLEFYNQLRKEADALRKEKKRNTYSGIHKYLYLLDGKSLYPCLKLEKNGPVISLPPITNSDVTKITTETTDILVEVTSSSSLAICKKVLDVLLHSTLQLGVGQNGCQNGDTVDEEVPNLLKVEQVKIVDKIGQLRAVYPSRTDLQLQNVRIMRNFD